MALCKNCGNLILHGRDGFCVVCDNIQTNWKATKTALDATYAALSAPNHPRARTAEEIATGFSCKPDASDAEKNTDCDAVMQTLAFEARARFELAKHIKKSDYISALQGKITIFPSAGDLDPSSHCEKGVDPVGGD